MELTPYPIIRLVEKFENQKVIIHRAALVISCKDDAPTHYSVPNALSITYTDPATGLGHLLPDYYLGLQNDYFGGRYHQTNKEYSFNITQYIQNLVNGVGENYPLNLMVSPSATHFSRLIIYGTMPADAYEKRLRLRINYTQIN